VEETETGDPGTGDPGTGNETETGTGDEAAETGAVEEGTGEVEKTTRIIPIWCRWAAARAGETKRRTTDEIVTIETTVEEATGIATIGMIVAVTRIGMIVAVTRIGMIGVTGIEMIGMRNVTIGTIARSHVDGMTVTKTRMTMMGRSTSVTTTTRRKEEARVKSRRHVVTAATMTTTTKTMRTVTVTSGKSPKSPAVTITTMMTTTRRRITPRAKRSGRIATDREKSRKTDITTGTVRGSVLREAKRRRKSHAGRTPRRRAR